MQGGFKAPGQICESADVAGARPIIVSLQHVLPESGSFFTWGLADLLNSVWIWTHSR